MPNFTLVLKFPNGGECNLADVSYQMKEEGGYPDSIEIVSSDDTSKMSQVYNTEF